MSAVCQVCGASHRGDHQCASPVGPRRRPRRWRACVVALLAFARDSAALMPDTGVRLDRGRVRIERTGEELSIGEVLGLAERGQLTPGGTLLRIENGMVRVAHDARCEPPAPSLDGVSVPLRRDELTREEHALLRARGNPRRCGRLVAYQLEHAPPERLLALDLPRWGCTDLVFPAAYRVEESAGLRKLWRGSKLVATLIDPPTAAPPSRPRAPTPRRTLHGGALFIDPTAEISCNGPCSEEEKRRYGWNARP